MAVNYNSVAEKVFKVLKGFGLPVKMFDSSDGNEIADPNTARFFFIAQPNMMINVDDQNNEIKMHKGPENSEDMQKLTDSLRSIAKNNLLDFDLREFGKEIKPKNYTFRLNTNTMSDNIQTEGLSAPIGTTKTSSQHLEGAKLLIKHRKPVNEEIPGSRSRNIKALYVENADGERFKYPYIHLNGARAMTRHVQAGGTPYDEVGQSITGMSEQLSKIREVVNIARRSAQMQEQAGSIINSLLARQDRLRETVRRLTTAEGYSQYAETYTAPVTKQLEQNTIDEMKNKFTVSNIDNRITELLPLIHEIHDEEINDTDSLRNRVLQKLDSPVEMHPRNQSQSDYDPSKVAQFSDKRAKVAYRLGDLAARAKDDEISIYLARMSDKFSGMDVEKEKPEDIDTIKSIIAKVQEPKPAVANSESVTENKELKEVTELTESFDRILGMFSPNHVAQHEDEVEENTLSTYASQQELTKMLQNSIEKAKELQRIQLDPHTAKDPELQKELMKRKAELNDEVHNIKARMADMGIKKENTVEEDNAFNTAAAQAAVAGKKEFSFNGKTYPVKMSKEAAQKLLDEQAVEEGRLKDERENMEADASDMSKEEFVKAHGEKYAHIWDKVQNELKYGTDESVEEGRVKDWLLDMEADAAAMSKEEFIKAHGEQHVDIWNRVQKEMDGDYEYMPEPEFESTENNTLARIIELSGLRK